ncbi:MAG: hypothetical protein JJLCMIEE_00722 [Acidimicrobiales bacterium]|nr:hypothetical protein [Acidimicrobiales bacterium]
MSTAKIRLVSTVVKKAKSGVAVSPDTVPGMSSVRWTLKSTGSSQWRRLVPAESAMSESLVATRTVSSNASM